MRWLLVALVACSSSPAPKSTPTPTTVEKPPPAGDPTPTPSKDPAPAPKLHETCGPSDECGAGMTCEKYFGIAGARGPQFKTCEIKCDKSTKCPDGTTCGIIADGPGSVCR